MEKKYTDTDIFEKSNYLHFACHNFSPGFRKALVTNAILYLDRIISARDDRASENTGCMSFCIRTCASACLKNYICVTYTVEREQDDCLLEIKKKDVL